MRQSLGGRDPTSRYTSTRMTDGDFGTSLHALRNDVEERWRDQQSAPPAIVYHYTSAQALQGIVSSSRLWATHTAEVNDTTELLHAANLLRKTLRARAGVATLPE